ncbi:dentin sialophosphoprotein-like [Xenopus tropicalis]|uniref:Dentin sialophosphoprotein-like n=1 Tax=Xenopus tropicalis TaxID=8364 RepID=A0A8J1IML7_XENTR|nr:dentin sialophosphoprotein-like [Xenopus tropicalis]
MKLILGLLVLFPWTLRAQDNQMVTSNDSDITTGVNSEQQTDASNSTSDQGSYNNTYNTLTTGSDSYTTETAAADAPTDSSDPLPTNSSSYNTDGNMLENKDALLVTSVNNNVLESTVMSSSPTSTDSGTYSTAESTVYSLSKSEGDSASEDQSNENSNSMESEQGDTSCAVYEILREAGMVGYRGLSAADWICVLKMTNLFHPSEKNAVRCRNLKSHKAKYSCECFGDNVHKYIQCQMKTMRDPTDLWNQFCNGKDLSQYTRACESQLPQEPRKY